MSCQHIDLLPAMLLPHQINLLTMNWRDTKNSLKCVAQDNCPPPADSPATSVLHFYFCLALSPGDEIC